MRVLVVDDESRMIDICKRILLKEGHQVLGESDANSALKILAKNSIDVVLSDLVMPDMDGMVFMGKVRELYPDVSFVIMTAFSTVESAVEAMKAGAKDYLQKPFRPEDLRLFMRRMERERRLEAENKYLRGLQESDDSVVQESPQMKHVVDMVMKAAVTSASVLITGPSGAGKERLAQLLHKSSERSSRPLITINCGAIPADLIESELFGHVAGAFTDARKDRSGMFRLADGGTLFLDEIGELRLDLQVKLLRALESGEIRPVGAELTETVDVRLISATNRNLEEQVAAGEFREDLYFRLNVLRIDVAPLRERKEDIIALAHIFLEEFAKRYRKEQLEMSKENEKILACYDWPGNVRELRHVIERAVILSEGTELDLMDLQGLPRIKTISGKMNLNGAGKEEGVRIGDPVSLAELEMKHIEALLKIHDGNRTKVAEVLGIDKSTLWRKLNRKTE